MRTPHASPGIELHDSYVGGGTEGLVGVPKPLSHSKR